MSIRKYKIHLLMVHSSTLTEEKSFDTKYKLLEPFELNEWKHFDIWIYWFVTFEWKLRSVGIEWPFKWNWMFQTIFKLLRHRVVFCVKSFASRMSINSNSFVYTYTHTYTMAIYSQNELYNSMVFIFATATSSNHTQYQLTN